LFSLFSLFPNSVLAPGFVRLWLPDLLSHEYYVAIYFLAQASYERAAKMHVSPAPDIDTRDFLLLLSVTSGDLGLWEQRRE
jgi:hypothetical protein